MVRDAYSMIRAPHMHLTQTVIEGLPGADFMRSVFVTLDSFGGRRNHCRVSPTLLC
jgi:hypothetical protein